MNHPTTLSQIFDDAVQIENEKERQDFIVRTCGDDDDLRHQAEELVRAFYQCDAVLLNSSVFVERGALRSLLLTGSQEPTEFAPQPNLGNLESEGDQVGNYYLEEKLGAGGFGVVYRALQKSPIRREVAVKLIKPGMDSQEVLSRFNLERQALAVMDHPSIAKIHDAGYTDSGRPYFAMELVHGVPINRYCDENKLSIHERIELMIKVCAGIQHAHQKGIIHRDVKPSNILVTSCEGVDIPKLIDFGVAKALNRQVNEDSIRTSFGQKIGTPLYMSPEQAKSGNVVDVDARADIYSLGAVIFELLTGTTPLTLESLSESDGRQIFEVIENIDTPIASKRLAQSSNSRDKVAHNRNANLSSLVKQVSGDLDWITAKALDPDRDRRYGSASELARDLRRYLEGEPVEAAQPSQWYRFKKFANRNFVAMVVAATVAGLLLASTAVSVWYGVKANQSALAAGKAQQNERIQKEKAVDAEKKQKKETERAIEAQVRERKEKEKFAVFFDSFDELLNIATQLDDSRRQEMIDSLVQQVLDGTQEVDGTSLGEIPELHAVVLNGWGMAFNKTEEHERRESILEKAHQVATDAFGKDDRETLDIFHQYVTASRENVSSKYRFRGPIPDELRPELEKTATLAQTLVALEEKTSGPESRLVAALRNLYYCQRQLGEKELAAETLKRSVQVVVNDPNASLDDIVNARLDEADGVEPLEKIKIYDATLAMLDTKKAEIPKEEFERHLFSLLLSRIGAFCALYRENEVVEDYKRVVELGKDHVDGGESSLHYAVFLMALGETLEDAAQYLEAFENYQKSLQTINLIRKASSTPQVRREFLLVNLRMITSGSKLGQIQRVQRLLESLPEFAKGYVPKYQLTALRLECYRATNCLKLGDREKAIEIMDQVVGIVDTDERIKDDRVKVEVRNRYANFLGSIEEHDAAIEQRLETLDRFQSISEGYVRATEGRLGADYAKAGKPKLARGLLEKTLAYYQERVGQQRNTLSEGRTWLVMTELGSVYAQLKEYEKSSSLLHDLLNQRLKFYGMETYQTLDARERLAEVYASAGLADKARQQIEAIDQAYREMFDRAATQWPDGWQRFNVANRRFESALKTTEYISDETWRKNQLKNTESQMLEHLSDLQKADLVDPLLKRDMLNRSIQAIVRCYELQAKPDKAAMWGAKLDEQ